MPHSALCIGSQDPTPSLSEAAVAAATATPAAVPRAAGAAEDNGATALELQCARRAA